MWQTSTGPRALTLHEKQLFASAIDFYLPLADGCVDRCALPLQLPSCLDKLSDLQLYFCLDAAVADLCGDGPPPEPAAWRDAIVWTLCELIDNCVIVDQDHRQHGERDADDTTGDDIDFRRAMAMPPDANISDAHLLLFRNQFVPPPHRWAERADDSAYFASAPTFPALQQLRKVLE